MPPDNPNSVETTGKTVDDAVLQALRRLNRTRNQVDVRVLSEGRPGVFGIGANEARVRVSVIGAAPAGDDPDEAPLPKIDDYADYAEVDRRPSGPGRGGAAPGVRPARAAATRRWVRRWPARRKTARHATARPDRARPPVVTAGATVIAIAAVIAAVTATRAGAATADADAAAKTATRSSGPSRCRSHCSPIPSSNPRTTRTPPNSRPPC